MENLVVVGNGMAGVACLEQILKHAPKFRVTVFGEVANALNRENLRNVPYGVSRNGLVQYPTDTLLPIVPSAGLVIEF